MNIRLGINIPVSAAEGAEPFHMAERAEELGFDFLSSSDHPIGREPSNETWTLLAMIAAKTKRIHILPRVLGVPFRNPVVTAKMAETLNRLSNERLILGLGAGGMDQEIEAMGATPTGAGPKVTALEEALQIIRGLWTQPDLTVHGEHYRTESATISPRPTTRIPIWLGTFGPRSLALTGRLADGWIPTLGHASRDEIPQMLDRIHRSRSDAGRSESAFQSILNVVVHIGGDTDGTAVAGTPDQITDQLGDLLDLGFDGVNFMPPNDEWANQAALLADEVGPALKAR